MFPRRIALVLLALVAASGAVSGCATVPVNPAATIAKLEKERAAKPKSVDVLRALGVQYYKQQQYPQAKAVLTEAVGLAPKDGVVALYLGLTAEAQNDYPGAKAAYSSYLKVGKTARVRSQLESRLAALARREIQESAKAAVAAESTLSKTPGELTTVGVLPFRFSGEDSTLKPLERGMAELLAVDLSRSSKLKVVERARLQAILDEIALSQSGVVDSTTAVRGGKLLQAGRLVEGSIIQSGTKLRADVTTVVVATSQLESPTTGEETLERFFELEKSIALGLFKSMGIVLTVAEQNAIEQRQTRSLQAFLAYSRGLEYEDQGRFDDASRAYGNAARIDPAFAGASQKSAESKSIASGNAVSSTTVEAGLKGSTEGAVVTAATQGNASPPAAGGAGGAGGAAAAAAEQLNPSTVSAATSGSSTTTSTPQRDPSAGTGADNPSTHGAKVTITIKPPTE